MRHPDETLEDKVFSGKYLDILKEPYELEIEEENTSFDNMSDKSDSDTSIDLEAASDGSEDEESDAYSEGNYGDLYNDRSDSSEGEEEAVAEEDGGAPSGSAEMSDAIDGEW